MSWADGRPQRVVDGLTGAGPARRSRRRARRRRPRAQPPPPRRGRAWPESSRLSQRVPDPAHGLDQTRPAAGLGLAPQVADVHVERIRREAEVVAPDALEDDRAREHLAGFVRNSSSSANSVRVRSICSPPRRTSRVPGSSSRSAKRSTSSSRADVRRRSARTPREQLLEREGLRHVVVGPGVETGDTVLDLVAGREHQHRHAIAARARAAGTPRDRPRSASARRGARRRVGFRRFPPAAGAPPGRLRQARSRSPRARAHALRDSRTARSSSTTRIFTSPLCLWKLRAG